MNKQDKILRITRSFIWSTFGNISKNMKSIFLLENAHHENMDFTIYFVFDKKAKELELEQALILGQDMENDLEYVNGKLCIEYDYIVSYENPNNSDIILCLFALNNQLQDYQIYHFLEKEYDINFSYKDKWIAFFAQILVNNVLETTIKSTLTIEENNYNSIVITFYQTSNNLKEQVLIFEKSLQKYIKESKLSIHLTIVAYNILDNPTLMSKGF
ncbi:hypothetical protein AD998_00965 [bacterium 336/3]|nr:hypothetical protein AD998_00965 [bacterium 336/3]